MEVIARKKRGLLLLYSLVVIATIALGILSVGLDDDSTEKGFMLIGCVIIAIVGLVICVGILRTPNIIIQYDGEYLILREGKFKVNQLGRVNYHRAHARGIHYSWGKIILLLNGQEIVYNNVADVEQVHNRLMELRLQAERNPKKEKIQ